MPVESIQSVDNRKPLRDFVNANPNKIAKEVYRNYERANFEKERKFDKRVDFAIKSLPVVATAAALLSGKSAKSAAKSGLRWGVILAAPMLAFGLGHSIERHNHNKVKPEQTRRNQKALITIGSIAASIGLVEAGLKGVEELSKNKTINRKADDFINAVRDGFNKFISKPKRFEFVDKLCSYAETATEKIPGSVKKFMPKAISKVPATVAIGAGLAIVGKVISDNAIRSAIKTNVKAEQFGAAKFLANSYAEENKQLKNENSILKETLGETLNAQEQEETAEAPVTSEADEYCEE